MARSSGTPEAAAPDPSASPARDDPFATSELRTRVLDAWRASAARFRADANLEEDLALDAYRDRAVVELAQNAADAATRAGVPGRVLLRLIVSAAPAAAATDHTAIRVPAPAPPGPAHGTLVVANAGEPLTPAGVESLSTLRASAKRDGDASTTGRFGVGFASVLGLTDEPGIRSRTGSVRWSRAGSARLAAGIHTLVPEIDRRGGSVPVLRLPFAADDTLGRVAPDAAYDTEVVLPLRDAAALESVRRQLAAIDDALLLTLPGLDEVIIEEVLPGAAVPPVPGDGGARTGIAVQGASPGAPVPQTLRRALRAEWSPGHVRVRDDGSTTVWRLEKREGELDPALLADRPVEEQGRTHWSVTVAVPVDDAGHPLPLPPTVPPVLHAPTPTDEELSLPALVIASVPVDPSRRRVADGPLAQEMLAIAGTVYARLVTAFARDPSVGPAALGLVPGPSWRGTVDGRLVEAALQELRTRAFVPRASGTAPDDAGIGEPGTAQPATAQPGTAQPATAQPATARPGAGRPGTAPDPGRERRLRPGEAVIVSGLGQGAGAAGSLAPLAAAVPALADPGWWRPDVLPRLGAHVVGVEEVVEALAATERPPREWYDIFGVLGSAGPEELAALPVPMADGRTVRGARGVFLPDETLPAEISVPGLRLVHPAAAHPLLVRLGAVEATPVAVLESAELAEWLGRWEEELYDDGDPAEADRLGATVLALVAAAGGVPAGLTTAGLTPLRDAGGEFARAEDLFLPGSPAAGLLDLSAEESYVADELVREWGPQVLAAAGVRTGLGVLAVPDVPLDAVIADSGTNDDGRPGDQVGSGLGAALSLVDLPDLGGWAGWAAARASVVLELRAIRDLDLVRADAWPAALRELAHDSATRAAVIEPADILDPDGRARRVLSYGAWWLRGHAVLDGRPLTAWCLPGADAVTAALLPPVPDMPGVDEAFLRACGVRGSVEDLLEDVDELLGLLADDGREVTAGPLVALYERIAGADPGAVTPPVRVRVPDGPGSRVVDAGDVVVADAPYWLQLRLGGVLPGDEALANVLDVPLAAEAMEVRIESEGRVVPVPPPVLVLTGEVPSVWEHEDLRVGDGAREWSVEWWVKDGAVHASTAWGMARGLAWASGHWAARHVLMEALRDPERAGELAAEQWYDPR